MAPWKGNRRVECPKSSSYKHNSGKVQDDWDAVAEALGVETQQESNAKPVRSGRAWSPDDVYRPSFFPPLTKEQSFSVRQSQADRVMTKPEAESRWDTKPMWCPICTEEMDSTDSSFLPCECGFRLCLFCYHTILTQDGRCPHCRKSYSFQNSFSAC
eukprot:Gb_06236 [translate_table: standard]